MTFTFAGLWAAEKQKRPDRHGEAASYHSLLSCPDVFSGYTSPKFADSLNGTVIHSSSIGHGSPGYSFATCPKSLC
jgi:hypothetical protein